jgi:hypothetical protein
VSAEGFAGFVEDEREDGEGCDRVGPFDFEKRVGGEAGEGDKGEVGAECGLGGVGAQGGALGLGGETAFLFGEPRHDECSGRKHGNSEIAGPGFGVSEQGANRDYSDEGGYDEQQSGGEAGGDALGAFGGRIAEAPEDDESGDQFDGAVTSEGSESGTVGAPGRVKREDGFEDHPGDGDGLNAVDRAQGFGRRDRRGSHSEIMTLVVRIPFGARGGVKKTRGPSTPFGGRLTSLGMTGFADTRSGSDLRLEGRMVRVCWGRRASCIVRTRRQIMGRNRIRGVIFAAVAMFVMAAAGWAQQGPEDGGHEVQVWTGGGYTIPGGTKNTGVWNLGLRYGWVLSRPHGPAFLNGRIEYAVDAVPMFLVFQPRNTAYGVGFNPFDVKWNFATRGRVVPYLEIDGGTLFTNHSVPAGTNAVNFTSSGVFGLHVLRDRWNWSIEARYMHISNAGLATPNPGINTFQVRLGVGKFVGRK